ncbi:hypothetical protein CAPTEDRAFT_206127 [Capitella teleta]|uniref:Antistasin-like domain-containing protein n=1 Tax=Capitella teleta TaxID=283909 RepID=R7UIE0_CAPTE|nr:hypothetical protein CAPTEDRAFT_206127 [Capitella teleta]|eukprot:ELU05868.1 hypothetical protein CAPTEDRAFT_206127 [Capitella teleta]
MLWKGFALILVLVQTSAALTIPCPDINCKVTCEYGFYPDEKYPDCPTCNCKPNPCSGKKYSRLMRMTWMLTLDLLTLDLLWYTVCALTPRDPLAECVPDCPQVLCKIYCEFGYYPDDNGCPICKCRPNPCSLVKCGFGTHCEVRQIQCVTTPCDSDLTAVCVPDDKPGQCPPSPLRACTDPTAKDQCQSDSECKEQDKCCKTVCAKECVAPMIIACAMVKCADPCENGFVYDSNGCQTCECATLDPCSTVLCEPGRICVAKKRKGEMKAICVKRKQDKPRKGGKPKLECPDNTGSFGICVEQCTSDDDCEGADMLCCSNGCGHVCNKGVKVKPGKH